MCVCVGELQEFLLYICNSDKTRKMTQKRKILWCTECYRKHTVARHHCDWAIEAVNNTASQLVQFRAGSLLPSSLRCQNALITSRSITCFTSAHTHTGSTVSYVGTARGNRNHGGCLFSTSAQVSFLLGSDPKRSFIIMVLHPWDIRKNNKEQQRHAVPLGTLAAPTSEKFHWSRAPWVSEYTTGWNQTPAPMRRSIWSVLKPSTLVTKGSWRLHHQTSDRDWISPDSSLLHTVTVATFKFHVL